MSSFFPKATQQTLVIVRQNNEKIWEILGEQKESSEVWTCPSIHVQIRLPLAEQLIAFLERFSKGLLPSHIEIVDSFYESLSPDHHLCLVKLSPGAPVDVQETPCSWLVIPHFLRQLPKTRARLPFLKAWQLLMGADQGKMEALTVDDLRRSVFPEKN